MLKFTTSVGTFNKYGYCPKKKTEYELLPIVKRIILEMHANCASTDVLRNYVITEIKNIVTRDVGNFCRREGIYGCPEFKQDLIQQNMINISETYWSTGFENLLIRTRKKEFCNPHNLDLRTMRDTIRECDLGIKKIAMRIVG